MKYAKTIAAALLVLSLCACGKKPTAVISPDIASPCPELQPLAVGDNIVQKYFEACDAYQECAIKHNALGGFNN